MLFRSDVPLYLSVPANSFAHRTASGSPEVLQLTHDEMVDEHEVILVGDQKMELPLYHVLTNVREKQEVFAFSTPMHCPSPTTVFHSFAKSPGGQDMLTIWDTAALLSLVPMSTVKALNLPFTPGSDVSFVVANGSSMAPVGYCTIQFSFLTDGGAGSSTPVFAEKVYVVDTAPFQLLLGIRFLHRHWGCIFVPWTKVILLRPSRVEIQGSLQKPSGTPLHSEVVDDLRLAEDDELPFTTADVLVTVPMHIEVGKKDLLAELDSPIQSDFGLSPPMAAVSRDFVRGIIKFGPSCPAPIVDKAIDLVLTHWSQFSWHEMDLGCIADVPYDTAYIDNSPCVCKSRKHNYGERNAAIIEAKSRPLIELGVYKRAGPEVVDRAQLVVVRTKPDDPMNLKYCRVAHDFRCKNDKALLVPVPMATRPELYSFLTRFKYFWKTDADRGFLQVVQAPQAIRHTGFELFHQLYVSERMLFGQINGPSFFELNFNVMAHDLKFNQKVVKNFFDDILGGAESGSSDAHAWNALLDSWDQILRQAQLHGWKFKPGKTEFGFEEIVAVGARYDGRTGTISMIDKLLDAVRSLRHPRTITEVRSLLGLFNQFRDRVPGYALRVQALTQLTRQRTSKDNRAAKGSITMTVEAAEEFQAMQEYLLSPAVLVVFRHGWKTFVYTDASLGTPSTPGGLGAVITHINPDENKEYVCAFASAGLTAAQKNYPPVRLEALAFVFALAKFYDWLDMNEFTWRTDAKAHKYITDNKLSPNPALVRYFVGLQAFRFTVEWIPGLKMIADPFSRMVIVKGDQQAFSVREFEVLRKLVFGDDLGQRLLNRSEASTATSSGVPASALFTWSMSDFPSEVGSPTRCLTKVITTLPHPVVEQLTGYPELPLTALPSVLLFTAPASEMSQPEVGVPKDRSVAPVEVGNVHTLLDQAYSPKDRAKLRALLHLREFFISGRVASDVTDVKWVKWLAKKLTFDGSTIWKIDKTLKLKVLETPMGLLAVLKELHDGFGHRALPAVYHHFKLRYWIPAAAKVIKHYIEGCSACQRLAAPNKFEVPGYQVQPDDVFSHWSIDCIGPFPADPRTGDLHVIMAVDWLSRWAEARAVNSVDAATCSEFIYTDICCRYGVPESLRTDHGRSFDNEIMANLSELLRIHHHMSTPYYPQSNGLVERLVQTFKSALKRSIQDQLAGAEGENDDPSPYWSHLVPSMLYAYRCSPHSALGGLSPAELLFGRILRLPGDHVFPNASMVTPAPNDPTATPTPNGSSATIDHKAAILQRIQFLSDVIPTLRAKPPPKDSPVAPALFGVGDKVWVRDSKYDVGFPPVFAPRWKGPFIVKDCLAKNVYRFWTDPQVSGKRSTALALPINGSRLRKATEQELLSLVEKLEKRALLDRVDEVTVTSARDNVDSTGDVAPVSFVLPFCGGLHR